MVLHGQKNMQESDSQLLTQFATHRDEAAFKTLTNRYLGLIYHIALRRIGDRQMAEEVSQNVLCAVVRKASGLVKNPDLLPAWLHRATLFESTKAMRSEASHQRRKQLVHPDEIDSTGDAATFMWTAALPVLDLALDRLSDSDRSIVLHHYFEGKSFGQISTEVSRPAATVQKQCRRALDKLARILRGKGVTLTVTALASGLASHTAEAAPAFLLKSAATKALAGAASRNEMLRTTQSSAEIPVRSSSQPSTAKTIRTGSKRITIDMLQRAMEEAESSRLKQFAFKAIIAGLDAGELETLIPQTFTLPEPWQKKTDLLRHLVAALAKTDPGLAVRCATKADPKIPIITNAGIELAIFRWATAEPDQAIEWLRELHSTPSGSNWHAFMEYQAAVAAPLILSSSPRAREIITLSPDAYPEYIVRDAMGLLRETKQKENDADFMVHAFSKFLPWIREFVSEDMKKKPSGMDQRQAFEYLLSRIDAWTTPMDNPITGKILKTLDLTPPEQRIIAEFQAQRILSLPYKTRPSPDRAKVESAARDWLQTHAPDQAEEIFTQAKSTATDGERRQIKNTLSNLAAREVVRDSDILYELERRDFSEFSEFLPQALEQARKIKDPAKRTETILRLEALENSAPAKP